MVNYLFFGVYMFIASRYISGGHWALAVVWLIGAWGFYFAGVIRQRAERERMQQLKEDIWAMKYAAMFSKEEGK